MEPPSKVTISQCGASVNIDDIDARGGVAAFFLDAVEGLMRGIIERQINDLICQEASILGDLLQGLIDDIDVAIDRLQGPIPVELQDPLYPEKNLNLPSEVKLIDLSADYAQVMFDYVNEFLGGTVDDPDSPKGTGLDLSINKIMRNTILNENRILVLNGTLFGTVFQGRDMLTNSTISVESINVYGLDTLVEFIPIDTIGNYTVASRLFWPLLKVGVVLNVEVSPSDAQDSVINGGQGTVRELIEVEIGVEEVDLDLAFMFAISEMNITDLSLGSFTDIQSVVSCFSNAIYDLEITDLSMVIGNVIPPTLDGFIATGIDDIVSTLSFALFEMYEGTLLNIVSRLMQVEIRKNLNNAIDAVINNDEKCNNQNNTSDEILNIPDFLLLPEDATSVGGLGTAPYGELFPLIFDTIIDEVEKGISSGTIKLNEMIRSATLAQSGYEGKLWFPSLVDFDTDFELGSLALGLQLKVYNTSFQNLDSVGLPINLLFPTNPHTIGNTVAFGLGGKKLMATTNVMFAINVPGKILFEPLIRFIMINNYLTLHFCRVSNVKERFANIVRS